MRKLYSYLAALFLCSLSTNTFAQLPTENAILEGSEFNMRLYKDVDFGALTINGEPMAETAINFDADQTTDEIKYNGYVPYRCSNEGLSNVWVATSTPNWNADRGLITNGSGPRGFLLSDMVAGQIIVLQGKNGGYNTGETNAEYNGFCVPNGQNYNNKTDWKWVFFDPIQVEDISDEVHAAQDKAAGELPEGQTAHDNYLYLRVVNSGWVSLPIERAASIRGFQVWIDAGAEEAVTAPSLKLTKVNGDARSLEFKAGESTLNKTCTTWYGIVDRGEVALFLEDSEEVDHIEYEYQLDEEGNQVLDGEGNPIIISETPVYKKKFTDEALTSGEYGANMYNPEDGSIDVYASDDEDGDGFVEIQAATVSETGMFSDVITLRVSVGEITLNAPTLTLTGINGDRRTYTVSWTNNTLCGEDWQIYVTGDDEEVAVEYDLNTIGEPVTVTKNITAVVRVEGYTDGVYTIDEVEGKGIDMRLSEVVGNGENEAHNWDFQNLSEGTLAKINLQVVDHYAVLDSDGNELRTYTVEQEANEQIPEDDLGVIVAVPQYFGWDGADSRNAARHWRTWIPTYEEDEQGNPTTTIVSSTYAEDLTGMFNGLVVDNTHDSYSTMAIFTDASGLFFMSRGTVEVSGLKYGEYVMVRSSAGTSVEQYLDATGAPMSLGFGNGVYLYSIDVFTYDSLPDAINAVENGLAKKGFVYSIDGRIVNRNGQLNGLQKGLYIINGQKVLVK